MVVITGHGTIARAVEAMKKGAYDFVTKPVDVKHLEIVLGKALEGFSLHAGVAVPAHRRDRLEHRCRYLLRPPLALERLTETSGGQLLYQLRRPWADHGRVSCRG